MQDPRLIHMVNGKETFPIAVYHTKIKSVLDQTSPPVDQAGWAIFVAALRTCFDEGRQALGAWVLAHPDLADQARFWLCELTDSLLKTLYIGGVQVSPIPNSLESISLVAVGGYGRGELAPFSDIDLLFLLPDEPAKWHEEFCTRLLYALWDFGLKIGHAVRTLEDCLVEARADITIRTSLLEQRFVIGNSELSSALVGILQKQLFEHSISAFLVAKLDERDRRHLRFGGRRYVLEPNIKEAKGGLRDLQTLYWLGKYITGAGDASDLLAHGFLGPDEFDQFRDAESFLWKVRFLLHLLTGRVQDVLSFDLQVEIAQVLGYQDQPDMRGVEFFMRDYFRAARLVGDLTRIVLTELEARHTDKHQGNQKSAFDDYALPDDFFLENGRLSFRDENALIDNPINMLELFVHALRMGCLIHPSAHRLLLRFQHLVTDSVRHSPQANTLFLSLLLDPKNPEEVLRAMNEVGLLGGFIPEWGRINAMMQYNMYHHYTVDEHTIGAISNLHDLEKGRLIEDLPIASGILAKGINRRVLYLALFCHDMGKGHLEPHEIVGGRIARTLGTRFLFSPDEIEQTVWLVQHHLDMSDAAQKRDLSDPKTIQDFAKLVKTQENLDLLLLLTVCDIRAVGPQTWNNWKAVLLRELYAVTTSRLSSKNDLSLHKNRVEDAKARLCEYLSDWPEDLRAAELGRHYADYWIGLDFETHQRFANLIRAMDGSAPQIQIPEYSRRDASAALFVMRDHPGLFARLSGAVSISGANIVDARTYTSSDALATTIFWIQDQDGHPYALDRHELLRSNVLRILEGKIIPKQALQKREKIKKRERAFLVPTSIRFDNSGSDISTIIEITTRDRLGLLYDVARVLARQNIQITSAIIATYGEEAIDSFYVKDIFGLKITTLDKQQKLESALIESIEHGFKEAIK